MPARRFPISDEAIAAAVRFVREGARAYTRAGEPSHPSLRQVGAHLVGLGLLTKAPPPVTLGRALARAGAALPAHWRGRRGIEVNISRQREANISRGAEANISHRRDQQKQVGALAYLCSSVDDGGTASPTARRAPPRPSLDHPWRPQRSETCSEHLPGRLLVAVAGRP